MLVPGNRIQLFGCEIAEWELPNSLVAEDGVDRSYRHHPAISGDISPPDIAWQQGGQRRHERIGRLSWAMFEWADAPFATLIITFVFPAYFATVIVGNDVRGRVLLGYTIALSGLAVAIMAPFLGAIADAGGRRKPWIVAFGLLCMVGSGLLWFARPTSSAAAWAFICVIVANLGYEFGIMFTNTMLPDIVPKDRIGRFSGWAWGLGYLGGLAAVRQQWRPLPARQEVNASAAPFDSIPLIQVRRTDARPS
jgi:hypothetical protein